MPKIKVYKHDGKAIPVDRAKESNAYECPFTGKIYISKRSYLHHLKNYRDEQIRKRIRGRRLTQAIADFNNLTSWKDVIKYIETTIGNIIRENSEINDLEIIIDFILSNLDIASAIEVFTAVRQSSFELLLTLTEEQLSNQCTHTESGPYTVRDWLSTYTRHPLDHAEQIRKQLRH